MSGRRVLRPAAFGMCASLPVPGHRRLKPQGVDHVEEDLGVVQQAAKEVRNRFTILHFLSELGLLEELSTAVAQEFVQG